MYIPLHVHYEKGSIGDSILKTKDAIKKAKHLGMTALAVTDHGSMSNVIDFYRECKNSNIKPIIGLEAYECDDRKEKERKSYHLVLIAKNEQGYEDLLAISNDSQMNGFYYKPRTDITVLRKYGKNIIALSACIGGRIPKMIMEIVKAGRDGITIDDELVADENVINNYIQDKYNQIIKLIAEYKEIFSDFYLELQPGDFETQITINNLLVELANETNTKLVITNDVHYLDKEDSKAHDYHVKMHQKKRHDDPEVYPDSCYYLMGEDEIRNLFPTIDINIVNEAINNTKLIADQIDLSTIYDGVIKMPTADIPEEHTEDSYLAELAYKEFYNKKYKLGDPSEYYDRLEYELETLKSVGFSGYLLIIKDLYDYSKLNNIPLGPGRGSIAGSLVAYLIGITKVDPIRYGLLFERFISSHRKGSVPDIDIDVGSSHRKQLFDYTIEKYGEEYCALVSTYSIRKAKSSIKDTARMFGIDKEFASYVAKLIPTTWYSDLDGEKLVDISIKQALEIVPELATIRSEYEDWLNAAMKLEDTAKNTSIHAAGTLISPVPLSKYLPLIRGKDGGMMATALNLKDSEYAGGIKYDYLGSATLDIIKATEMDTGFYADFDDSRWLSDPLVWDTISSNNTETLFQISSNTYKKRMKRLNPRTIEQLAACLALVRGPCISSKLDEVYMQIVEGTRDIELIHPFYDSVCKDTNGVLLYQEQLMEVLVNFGMDLERAFQVMKYAAKKNFENLRKAEIEFRNLAYIHNVSDEITDKIWGIILHMGEYSFNKSHAISYALVCYYTAYFKTFHKVTWMKNALTNAYDRKESMAETIQECRRLGIKFIGLDLNKSKWEFTEHNGSICLGFVAVKGLGSVAYEALNDSRPYFSLEDAVNRVTSKFNKGSFVASIFGGAFDCFGDSRELTYETFCTLRKFDSTLPIKSGDGSFKKDDDLQIIEGLIYEVPIISNPAQDFEHFDLDNLAQGTVCDIKAVVRKVKKIKDRNKNNMAFLTLETYSGYVEGVVFSGAYKGNSKYMKNNKVININVKKDKETLIVQKFIA